MSDTFSNSALIIVPFVVLIAVFMFRLDEHLFAAPKRPGRPERRFSTPDDAGDAHLFDPDGRRVIDRTRS